MIIDITESSKNSLFSEKSFEDARKRKEKESESAKKAFEKEVEKRNEFNKRFDEFRGIVSSIIGKYNKVLMKFSGYYTRDFTYGKSGYTIAYFKNFVSSDKENMDKFLDELNSRLHNSYKARFKITDGSHSLVIS